MKLGLLADIHANIDALETVLRVAKTMGVEELLVAGDMVGYYFSPKDVIDLLKTWKVHYVRGNHEDMLIKVLQSDDSLGEINKKYGSGIEIALNQLTEEDLRWICGLPHPLNLDFDGCKILLSHGSPNNLNLYIYPDAPDSNFRNCLIPNCNFIVMGHTHYQMHKSIDGINLINPGSVGQPRNRNPGAQWAILDTETGDIEFRNESYDKSSLLQECKKRHPDLIYLAEILERT